MCLSITLRVSRYAQEGAHGHLYPYVSHNPDAAETLTYACMHTLRLRLLAFYSAAKIDNQQTPHTHMSLPATWWSLSTANQLQELGAPLLTVA
jgi:hypothetical protein